MEKGAIFAIIAVVVIVGAGAAGFAMMNKDKDDSAGEVTDAMGRQVAIPDNLDKGIVTIGGSGPLRFASMFDIRDKVIEVDKGDITDNRNGRAYSYAYDYYKMDVETQSHPDGKLEAATAESIGNKNPSLVITNEGTWKNYADNFEILAKRCTVVVIKDQQMKFMTGDDGKLADYMTFNINLLGKVFKKESRAEELINGINGIIADIASLKGTSDKKIYVAGVTIQGSNPLNTTFPTYMPFSLTSSTNAYDLGSTDNKVSLTNEQFTSLDIDMIIIDPSSSDKIKDQGGNVNQDSKYVLQYLYGLSASERPKMYITVPIVWDSINYDCALASAYVVTYLNYGGLTLDELTAKINNIFTTFYGTHGANVLKDMQTFFQGKSTDCGQQMPMFKEVVIDKVSDDEYRLIAASA